nr:TonB-dependent receptor [uncultured Undibacterium sp.]
MLNQQTSTRLEHLPDQRKQVQMPECKPVTKTIIALGILILSSCTYAQSQEVVVNERVVQEAAEQAAELAAKQVPLRVEIKAKMQPNRDRQDDIGMRVVYGSDDIKKYGDTNISEVLKRLPGISISESKGKGLEIRMRGLGNGYTQILLNGQATPVGFSIDSVAPDLIESIEVMRVAGADVSAQSIAGTINIVLKKKSSQQPTEIKSAISQESGELSGNVSWSMADQLPSQFANLSFVLAGTLESSRNEINHQQREAYAIRPKGLENWQLQTDRLLQQSQKNSRDAASFSPRLNWKMDALNNLNWQASINLGRLGQNKYENENSILGESTEFPNNSSVWSAHVFSTRQDFGWERRFADSAKLSMNLGWNSFDRSGRFHFWGKDQEGALRVHRYVAGDADETEARFHGKYLAPYSVSHVFSVGWEMSHALRHENREEQERALPSGITDHTAHDYQASVRKLAAYLQDEWTINNAWSSYLGLRMENIRSGSKEQGAFDIQNSSSLFSPILQSLVKLDKQRQWRMALNRSFKLPVVANLVPRLLRIDNNNTPLNPDTQGNPNLRPERSWGLELAYEHYLSDSSVISASAYWRRVDDVITEHLSLNGNSWLSSFINHGQARLMGLEIETKLNLRQLSARLPAVEIHANLNRNWSKLEQVPGPDNRLAQQTGLLVSIGGDYQFHPDIRLGADYSFQAADNLRESAYLNGHSQPKRLLDFYIAWQLSPQHQLRFSGTNLLHQNRVDTTNYTSSSARWSELSQQQSATTWRLVWGSKW